MNRGAHAAMVIVAGLMAGCGEAADTDQRAEEVAMDPSMQVAEAYAAELNVDLSSMDRSSTGLYIEDLQAGDGEPADSGDTVVVHYTGWLPDGTKFDSSRDRDEPFSTQIGVGRVIRGWDEGIQGMRPGGQRRLVIPSGLAYGARGAGGVIPPGATLVFDVELLEVR